MRRGSAPIVPRLRGASIAIRRFDGKELGGLIALISAPDAVLTQTTRHLTDGCEQFTAVHGDGLEVSYEIAVVQPIDIGVTAPTDGQLFVTRTEVQTPDDVATSYEAEVVGRGLAALVLLLTGAEQSEAEKAARQRSAAELVVQQWQAANELASS